MASGDAGKILRALDDVMRKLDEILRELRRLR